MCLSAALCSPQPLKDCHDLSSILGVALWISAWPGNLGYQMIHLHRLATDKIIFENWFSVVKMICIA
jgi:hypothetical protein